MKTFSTQVVSLLHDDGDVAYHIIKSCSKDQYLVVQENAYQDKDHGTCVIKTKQQIQELFNINIEETKP